MMKYNKILTAILAGTISITSLSAFISDNQAEAKRINGRTKKDNSSNIQESINFIDSQISIKDNKFIANKTSILEYITKNWEKLNLNNEYNTPIEYYNNVIESSLNTLNNNLSTGQYKVIENKGITLKYQERLGGSYYHNTYWWGEEFLVYNGQQKAELARDLGISATAVGTGALSQYPYYKSDSVLAPLLTVLCHKELVLFGQID